MWSPNSPETTYAIALDRQRELVASAERGGSPLLQELLERLRGALGR